MLVASSEVSRLSGAPEQAEASLRQALRIYEDRHAVALAGRTRADLARWPPAQPPGRPDRPRIRLQQNFNNSSTLFAEARLKGPGHRAQANTRSRPRGP
jgi:hypothetical protein